MPKPKRPNAQKVGRYAIKAYIYPSSQARQRHVDGPWADTPEEAIKKFGEHFEKRLWRSFGLYDVFVARSLKYGTGGQNDGRYDYEVAYYDQQVLARLLRDEGLKPMTFFASTKGAGK